MKLPITLRLYLVRLGARFMIPGPVREIARTLSSHGHEAYVVGGCVRDLVLGRTPHDWDVATDAPPAAVMSVFPDVRPTGVKHGTVTVIMRGMPVEVTTYRVEGRYTDRRHPDVVRFVRRLEDDLGRRDLTINAIALHPGGRIIDPYRGVDDLKRRLVRAVGDPLARFDEDPLRMLRAIRLAAELVFDMDEKTYEAIKAKASLIRNVSAERIGEEVARALVSPKPGFAMELMRETGLLKYVIPELLEGYGFPQNEHHAYPVWEHSLIALEEMPPVLHLRWAGLLHDVGKPRTASIVDGERHFFNHEYVGASMAENILRRLRFDQKTVEKVTHLVRNHMALHYQNDMTDAAIRRLIRRVGLENMPDLITLRRADRIASGKKEGELSRGTELLLDRIQAVLAEEAAFSLKDLAVDGHDVMAVAGIGPGPTVGRILRALFDDVLENPHHNTREYLLPRIVALKSELASVSNTAGNDRVSAEMDVHDHPS